MNNSKKTLCKQAKGLVIVLLIACVMPPAAFSGKQDKSGGELALTGNALVNGKPATNGMPIARGNRIQTERDGTAIVNLGRLGRVAVQTETDFLLDFQDNSFKGTLNNGTVVINIPNGIMANIVTPNGEINLPVEYAPATLTVGVTSQGTHAFVRREQDRPRSLRPVDRSSFDKAPNRQTGELWVLGNATVNGKLANTGTIVWQGSRIVTDAGSSVVVNLGKLGRISIQPGSDFLLDFRENTIYGNLLAGHIVQDIPGGVVVNILTPNGESNVRGEQSPSTLTVDITENNMYAFLRRSDSDPGLTRGLIPTPNPFPSWVLPVLGASAGVGVGLVTLLPDPAPLTPVVP